MSLCHLSAGGQGDRPLLLRGGEAEYNFSLVLYFEFNLFAIYIYLKDIFTIPFSDSVKVE